MSVILDKGNESGEDRRKSEGLALALDPLVITRCPGNEQRACNEHLHLAVNSQTKIKITDPHTEELVNRKLLLKCFLRFV